MKNVKPPIAPPRIFECEQGSPEWFEHKRGVPSASNFDRIIMAKTGKTSTAQAEFICELIADLMRLGPADEGYMSRDMMNGKKTEDAARAWYEMQTRKTVQRVGFILDGEGRFGCSPDGLIGDPGGLELKCPKGKTHARYLLAGRVVPPDYLPQVHGSLIVTGRAWWDFLSYCPGMPPLLVRTKPNEYTENLRRELAAFWIRFQEAVSKVRAL